MTGLTLLFVDADDTLDSEPDLWVRDAASYLDARRAVTTAFAAGAPLRVAVAGPRMQAWVRDLGPLAEVVEAGLRAQLARRWGCLLPPGLTASEIRALGLDGLAPPSGTAEDAVLAHALGPVWATPTPSPSHLASLVLADPAEPATPWVRDRLARRLDEWAGAAGPLAGAYAVARDAPTGFRAAVTATAAARSLDHPDLDGLDEGLNPDAVARAADAVLVSDRRDQAVAAGRARLRPALLRLWRGRLSAQSGSLAEVARRLLRDAPSEAIEALADLAEGEAPVLTNRRLAPADLDGLRRLFGGDDAAAGSLARLARFVVPEPPPNPDPVWADAVGLDPWRPWLEAYLPYRAAVDRVGASDADLDALERRATAFSDWVTAQYATLVKDGAALVTSVHRAVRARVEAGHRVLWVIWDNLPAHHAAPLAGAFAGHGLSLAADPDWRLALLPSVTAVSFPALLAGRQTGRSEGRGDAGRLALLEQTFPGLSVRFQNTLRGVERLGLDPADVHVVHFTDYDALLHKPEHALSDSREALLARERDEVARRLAEAVGQFPRDRPVAVVVTSDHGSTRLPPRATAEVPLPGGAEPVEDYGSRAVRVSLQTPSSDDVCTRLDPAVTGLDGPVLLARGFRSWSTPRAGAGYVHGGALPEEVLVPVMTLTPEAAPLAPLALRLVEPAPLAVGTPAALSVRVRNPNGAVARDARVAAWVGGAERSAAVLPGPVPADAEVSAEVPFTPLPADVADGAVRVRLVVTATVLGRAERAEAPTEVPVQSALRSRADDDLFDF